MHNLYCEIFNKKTTILAEIMRNKTVKVLLVFVEIELGFTERKVL